MAAVAEQRVGYVVGAGGGEGAGRGEDRTVTVTACHHDGQRGRQGGVDPYSTGVDAPRGQRRYDEPSGLVVSDAPGEGDLQSEPGGAARHDRGGAAECQQPAVDELFALTEGEGRVEWSDDDVGVDVPDDEKVESAGAGRVVGVGRVVRHPASLEYTAT